MSLIYHTLILTYPFFVLQNTDTKSSGSGSGAVSASAPGLGGAVPGGVQGNPGAEGVGAGAEDGTDSAPRYQHTLSIHPSNTHN